MKILTTGIRASFLILAIFALIIQTTPFSITEATAENKEQNTKEKNQPQAKAGELIIKFKKNASLEKNIFSSNSKDYAKTLNVPGEFIKKVKNYKQNNNFNSNKPTDLNYYATVSFANTEGSRKFLGIKTQSSALITDKGIKVDTFTQSLKRKLSNNPNVESVAYSIRKELRMSPNDTFYAEPGYDYLWGLENTGQFHLDDDGGEFVGLNDADIDAEAGWDLDTSNGGEDMVVAVTDTGIDYTHPDLENNLWINQGEIPSTIKSAIDTNADNEVTSSEILAYCQTNCTDINLDGKKNFKDVLRGGLPALINGIDDDLNGYPDDLIGWDFGEWDNDPYDDYGHGTHVSGTIAASGNNNLGVIGVAYNTKILAVKISYMDYYVELVDDTTLATALFYASQSGITASINMSWGNYSDYSSWGVDPLYNSLESVSNMGTIPVASSGNYSEDVNLVKDTPSSYDNVVTVNASNSYDDPASFTNFGPGTDITAPGRSILSTVPDYYDDYYGNTLTDTDGSKYASESGTSMASPHVSGAIALIKANHPGYDFNDILQHLRNNSDDLGDLGFDEYNAYGRLNLEKLLNPSITDNYPVAKITSPYYYDSVGSAITVEGEASGDLATWSLEYKNTIDSTWTEISNGTTATTTFVSDYDLSTFANGDYYIRLKVAGNNGYTSTDLTKINIFNCPQGNWVGSYDDYLQDTIVRCDPEINFDWGYNAPALPGISDFDTNYFDINWVGEFYFDKTTDYTFNMESDDRMYVFIDGEYSNYDTYTGYDAYSYVEELTQGTHEIEVFYEEHYDEALAKLSWEETMCPEYLYYKFSDVYVNNPFYNYICNLKKDNVIGGYSNGTFQPNDNVTRGAMAKFIMNGFGFTENLTCGAFPDVGSDHPFYSYITTLKCEGVIGGYPDGNFKPEGLVTRGAAMKFMMNAKVNKENNPDLLTNFGDASFTDVGSSHPFYQYILSGANLNIVGGYSDGTFKPNDNVSRGAMSKIVDNGRRL